MTDLPVSEGLIAFPDNAGHWVLTNVFTRRSIALDRKGLVLASRALANGVATAIGDAEDDQFRYWPIGRFSNVDGLLADPTGFERKPENWPPSVETDAGGLINRLRQELILIDNRSAFRDCFQDKASLLDRNHFGNFHQQLGQTLMLEHRIASADWWLDQKFEEGCTALRDNLYRAVQGYFLETYFEQRMEAGSSVLDIGCGPGFFTNMIARAGCRVTGIDPNPEYIDIAKRNATEGAEFVRMDIGVGGSLKDVPTDSADYVFMSDALLFYFVPFEAGESANISILFDDIRRILKPGGTFISVEPHYVFWLAPWYGEVDRPFTALAEYAETSFAVTPTISGLIKAFAEGGFAVTWMEEMHPDPAFEKRDPRAYHFARQFPQWQLFELIARTDRA